MIDIDQIRAAWMKMEETLPGIPRHVILHGHVARGRVTVGELFGMPLVSDPECPPDTFFIEAIPQSNEEE